MRFTCTSQGTQSVTAANMLDWLVVSSTATAAWDLFDVVRLHEIEMWCAFVGSTPVSVGFEFNGQSAAVAGDGRNYSDTSMGVQPAHVRGRPNKRSGSAQWQASSNFPMFTAFNCVVGTIIDVTCEYRNIEAPPTAAANATVAAVPGQWYYRGMDALAAAGTKFPATGVVGTI